MTFFQTTFCTKTGIFIVLFFLSGQASAQYYSARIYKDEEGMISNRLTDMVQAASHEIWVASENGLIVYDALDWTTVQDTANALSLHGNVKLKATGDSSIYVLGQHGSGHKIVRFHKKTWADIPLPADLSTLTSPCKIDRSPDFHGLVISTDSNVYVYDQKRWSGFSLRREAEVLNVNRIEIMGDSILLATNSGLFSRKGEKLQQLTDRPVYDFCEDPQSGKIFLLGRDWLGHYDNGKTEIILSGIAIGLVDSEPVTNILKLGTKLYYNFNSPLHSYDVVTGDHQMIITESFDKDYSSSKVMGDHEGNIWVATLRGCFKLYGHGIYNYDKNQLLENEVTAVLEASSGDIFLGTNSGFQILKADGKIFRYPFSASYFQSRVMDIVEHQGVIYMAANTMGVVKYEKGKVSNHLSNGALSRVVDLHVFDNELYAASGDMVYRLTNGEWTPHSHAPAVHGTGSFIRKIYFEGENRYLLTGFGVYDLNSKNFATGDNNAISSIYDGIRYQDTLYLASQSGVAKLVNHEILPAAFPLKPENAVYALLIDQQNNLWSGTENGIFNLTEDPLLHVSVDNGLIGNEINRNAFVQLKNGKIMIGTDEGLSVYDPRYEIKYPNPDAELTSVLANDEPITTKNIDHAQNNLKFNFRAISYYNESRTNYRVRLDGFDKCWQLLPYASQRNVTYTNLPPGEYKIRVQARVADGSWGKEVTGQVIHISPAIYETIWFRVLSLMLLAVLVALVVYQRNKHLNNRNRVLKDRVDEKTKELHIQNTRLLKTIRDLKMAQGQLIQSEKLTSMGLLTAGIAHEMNNPLNYIRGGAECLKRNLQEINELNGNPDSSGPGTQKDWEYLMNESFELIDSILRGAEKSTGIIKSLSSFTADSQNFFSLVELEQEVETALTLMNNQIGFRITINKFYGSIPKIECYPAKINQLLVNILLNATQAIKKEGEITIRINRKDDEHVGLEISDTGPGVELDNLEKVFEPFFTTKDHHTGLGLTIVKSIIRDHQGEIRFHSVPQRGSKVVIKLPIYQTSHPELT